jgi:hypothetical protein
MMETPTLEIAIMQPMLTAVSLANDEAISVVIEGVAPAAARSHDGLQA